MKVGSVESQTGTAYNQFPSRGLPPTFVVSKGCQAISKVNDDHTVTHREKELAHPSSMEAPGVAVGKGIEFSDEAYFCDRWSRQFSWQRPDIRVDWNAS